VGVKPEEGGANLPAAESTKIGVMVAKFSPEIDAYSFHQIETSPIVLRFQPVIKCVRAIEEVFAPLLTIQECRECGGIS
jgi:hypothetical protein